MGDKEGDNNNLFTVGKWYVCKLKEAPNSWNTKMEDWLDGKPKKCLGTWGNRAAKFTGIEGDYWSYIGGQLEECDPPTKHTFKVGDKVRLKGTKDGSVEEFESFKKDFGAFDFEKGEIHTLRPNIDKDPEILNLDGWYFIEEDLEPVTETRLTKEDLENTRVRVSSPENSRKIQEIALGLGFTWLGGAITPQYYKNKYLYFKEKKITCSDTEEYFKAHQNREVTEEYILGTQQNNTTQDEVKQKMEMKKATTKLEKQALKEAKEEAIKREVARAKKSFDSGMVDFLAEEKKAREHRAEADRLAKLLELTKEDIKALFN